MATRTNDNDDNDDSAVHMSWTATTGYSPTILKKPSSAGTIVGNSAHGSSSNGQQTLNGAFSACAGWENGAASSTSEQEVVVPLVLWNEPPRVEISCLHVLHLPLSQPSQNSNTTASGGRQPSLSSSSASSARRHPSRSNGATAAFAGLQIQIVDDDDEGDDAAQYQVCVFAGTVDGTVIYWLFEQEAVVQVNLLVFPGAEVDGSEQQRRVQSIVSGTDEWGQSMVLSITRDGSVARWQLPNGLCSCASASLAKQLAPIKGMEMFCNNRYAMVYSEETRMMVLDTWKMALLYCVDTAQEQIRRSIAVGELKMLPFKSTWTAFSKNPLGASGASARGESASTGAALSASSGANAASSAASVSVTTRSGSNTAAPTSASQTQSTYQVWDSLVVSLGAEGLVKCFLWSKPRGSSSASSTATTAAFQWVQESCWVISWADEADDITCSQSTSLKDGDHMNPQTALMRSIKSSYFPLAVRISPDSSLILFIWATKWAVLKRKWLCKVDGVASSASGANASPRSKAKPPVLVGSCNIPPAAFLGQSHVPRDRGSASERLASAPLPRDAISWANGEFVGDNQVMLWTTTGHVFQFASCGNSMSSAGKLFIFTKDQDQFVPRSNFKNLTAIEKGQFIAFLKQCACCESQSDARRTLRSSHDAAAGFTSCVQAAGSYFVPSSPLSSALTQTKLVHMCRRGSLGFWDIPLNKCASPPRMTKSHALPVHLYDRVQFHAFADGFDATQQRQASASSGAAVRRRVSLSHLMLGRDDAGVSCTVDATQHRLGVRRRQRSRRGRHASSALLARGNGSDSPVTNVLSSALGPIVARNALSQQEQQQRRATTTASGSALSDPTASQYLLDVPVAVTGFSDGSIEISLLGRARSASSSLVHLTCHRGSVTAVAHCHWTAPSPVAAADSPPLPPSPLLRSTTTAGASSSGGGIYMSMKKAKTFKRGVPVEESILASDKNPFYRSRFAAPTQRRSWSSRHLSTGASLSASLPTSASAPCSPNIGPSPSTGASSTAAIYFMVFTGGDDGAMRVIEVAIRPVEATFVCEAVVLQKFQKHRGAIQEIAVSPVRDSGSSWSAQAPDRLVATVGVDRKVTLFAPVYGYHPSNRSGFASSAASTTSKGRCAVEWECVLELSEHNDAIYRLDWHLERGLVYVECDDRMVYVWNVDTGILERSIPAALLGDGGNAVSDDLPDASETRDSSARSVESTELCIGDSSVRLLQFGVIQSAERIKQSWKSYFVGLSSAEPPLLSGPRATASSAVSPYAIGSIELLLLSFLLSWGATPEIDRACRDLLGLDAPELLYSCALRDGPSGALTIPVPWKASVKPTAAAATSQLSANQAAHAPAANAFVRNWQHSSALSANLALGIVSLCMNLMEHKYSKASGAESQALPSSPKNKEEFHVLWSQLITQHSVVLPDYVPSFREPALEYLAKFGFNTCDYTQLAARALLNGVIKRLPASARSALTAEYSTKLHFEIVRLEMETGSKLNGSSTGQAIDFELVVARLGSLVILLSMIGTCFPGEISPAGAREVCDILVYLLKAPAQHIGSVSAELLTKGLMLFRPHLVDLSSLVVQLLLIDMREKQRHPDGSSSPVFGSNARVLANGGSNASLSLLIELGACESAFVLALLQQEMNNSERPHAFRECVLLYLTELINTHYLLMFRHLPAVVDTIMCCLDPTKLERRKRCLELSTRCLHNLVRRFPMIDFHKETQRLAIGTMEAVILIYDLRTATKWRVLDGHTSAISAIAFRVDGQILVSYAAREASVRWWNSGNAGLFGGMLKMQQSCLKEHKLDVVKTTASAPVSSGGASADLKQVIQTCRFQFLTLKEPSLAAPHAGHAAELKEKRILRLTREDASQVQFLL